MSPFLGEVIGTMILILLGNGVVANVVLNKTKGNSSGWIVITMGWGMAVFTAVYVVGQFSGAHINPARDLGPRIMHSILPIPNKGDSDWGYAWIPIVGPIIGAVLAALLYMYL